MRYISRSEVKQLPRPPARAFMVMRSKAFRESLLYILAGLLLLALGSALLLARKLFVTGLIGDLSVFAGGVAVLFGNGCIIYGLLIFAGNRDD